MEKTFCNDEFIVFDNVLNEHSRSLLFDFFRAQDFHLVHETPYNLPEKLRSSYKRVWRFDEKSPMAGPTFAVLHPATPRDQKTALQNVVKQWSENAGMSFYPTQTALDFLLECLQKLVVDELNEWVGQAGKDWYFLTATPQVFPPETGLSWHADALLYTGSFSYFVHPEWEPDFGGELLIGQKSQPPKDVWKNRSFDPLTYRFPDNRAEKELDQVVFNGQFVLPVPNRLVIISRGILHKVCKVSTLAGSHVRSAVTGFFVDGAQMPKSE